MKQITQNKLVERIELELLSALFNYIVPFIDRRAKGHRKEQDQGNLESIVNKKPKIEFQDIKELESLILRNLSENVKVDKKLGAGKKDIFHSLSLSRQKKVSEKSDKYSISIKYGENSQEDKLSISVEKDGQGVYSTEIANKKDEKAKIAPYSINISYEDNYAEERLTITYRQQLNNYLKKHIENREDMTNMVPLKWLNIFPESVMGRILGFTYLGENFMGRRADLTGKTARMVDIHESIHTPDEYETRVLTRWIMEKVRSKYVK